MDLSVAGPGARGRLILEGNHHVESDTTFCSPNATQTESGPTERSPVFKIAKFYCPRPKDTKLTQVPYRESGSLSLNGSNHKNADATGFVKDWLVPILNLAEK